MNKATIASLALASLVLCGNAEAIEFNKPITASVVTTGQNTNSLFAAAGQMQPSKKPVMLMNIPLTARQKQSLHQFHIEAGNNTASDNTSGLPRQADVGMNGVPVLDQGQHGACVTFAVTAAVDALLGKGDYLSQLCSLELGSYFQEKGYLPSGWDGTLGPLVLNQLLGFGVINKNNQKLKSCGGLKEYPILNRNTQGSPMSLDEYKLMSENLNDSIYWDSILSFYQRFEWDPRSSNQADALLSEVKKTLAKKPSYMDTRLSFAVLLPVDYCSAGACARYHAEEDTWALTKAIKQDNDPNFGGHEMVITGYDDDAVAVDHDGVRHQGLLHIRNSWGTNAGDHGDYYMTYDFFKSFVVEVQKIVIEKE